jgi:hypothetical protein
VVDVTVDPFLDGHAVAVDRARVCGQPVDLQRLGRADEVNHRPELLGVLLGLEGHRSLAAIEPEHDIPVARGVPARPLLDGRTAAQSTAEVLVGALVTASGDFYAV